MLAGGARRNWQQRQFDLGWRMGRVVRRGRAGRSQPGLRWWGHRSRSRGWGPATGTTARQRGGGDGSDDPRYSHHAHCDESEPRRRSGSLTGVKFAALAASAVLLAFAAVACSGTSAVAPPSRSSSLAAVSSLSRGQADALLSDAVPASWTAAAAGPISVRVPASWRVTPYLGEPAPVLFPLLHVSTFRLTGDCASQHRAVQMRTNCFDHQWPVPPAGAILGWSVVQIPGKAEYRGQRGRPVAIGPYRGKLRVATDAAGTQIRAVVRVPGASGEFVRMDGQAGASASKQTLADMLRVLRSIHIRR